MNQELQTKLAHATQYFQITDEIADRIIEQENTVDYLEANFRESMEAGAKSSNIMRTLGCFGTLFVMQIGDIFYSSFFSSATSNRCAGAESSEERLLSRFLSSIVFPTTTTFTHPEEPQRATKRFIRFSIYSLFT